MKKYNSIVRTKKTFGNLKEPEKMFYKIEFMTFQNAVNKLNARFVSPDEFFEIYPYKWYDLRWIYEIPAYWILFRILRTKEHNISTAKHKAMSITVLITEILAVIKPIKELIKFFIINF